MPDMQQVREVLSKAGIVGSDQETTLKYAMGVTGAQDTNGLVGHIRRGVYEHLVREYGHDASRVAAVLLKSDLA